MTTTSVFLSVIASFLTITSYGQENSVSIVVDASSKAVKVTEATKMAGKAVFATSCQSCHTNIAESKAPSLAMLGAMSPRAIYTALKTGKMQTQSQSLSDEQRREVAQWITNRPFAETKLPKAAFVPFSLPKNVPVSSGWGGNLAGTGFTQNTRITPENVTSLKVKWTFAFPDGTQIRSKPAVVGDWLLVGSQFGDVYAIQKQTGKIGWHFVGDAPIRGAIFIGKSGDKLRAYFADFTTNVYAVDVASGKLIWKKRAGQHPQSGNTGSVAVYQNTIIVPLTSNEVTTSKDPNYTCCTSSGEVIALNATTGDLMWRHRVIPQEALVSGKKKNGQNFYGPSGAPVWSSPTIDTKRGLVYIGTGENYTDPPSTTSDAIQALDIKTGKLVWSYQATSHDTWNLACPGDPNCPEKAGPDLDFGMAPLLVTTKQGRDMLVVGQKAGVIHALDPATGSILWQTRIGKGGMLGGIHWGMASDGNYVYAANADNSLVLDPRDPNRKASPGLYALDVNTGKVVWNQPTPNVETGKPYIQANSAAPLLIPGLVFAGSLDGHIRSYEASTGKIVWDFDTVQEFKTSNGIAGKGGSIDGPSPVVSGSMLFVNSGYGMFGETPGNVLIAFDLDN
ncbi:outer membrane protein assembly factor BamB family protein [Spirosoma fluviale]|uniref:Polyvinyl alcohol dehydrogenase (Cytochrome) n=1 Tax=Spirosoma fluviale TaxID=1597977 RepID=A0A286GPK6_9BACT|nr:PQQ-binding-like beta-propeller repeat protein [Spirosoma fluviale]SOD97460.1 polyvinyl alcohol dehydrogenase (cytochrome) [Spirosoma fluviale]